MPQTKIEGKFYPLQHDELISLNKKLTASELSIYLWLKTKDPFGDKLVEADTLKIAEDLNVSRRTVQRALVKLDREELIDLVITKFHYRVKSAKSSDRQITEVKERLRVATPVSPSDTKIAEATPRSPQRHQDRRSATSVAEVSPVSPVSSETQSEQEVQNSKIIKTYSDFKDSLSDSERENFFDFVKEKTKNLNQPINDIEAWLASTNKAGQNRWEVYYNNFLDSLKSKGLDPQKPLNENNIQQQVKKYEEELEQRKKAALLAWEKRQLEQKTQNCSNNDEKANSTENASQGSNVNYCFQNISLKKFDDLNLNRQNVPNPQLTSTF
jgi:DNA-binding MarR family transcriptional regulator